MRMKKEIWLKALLAAMAARAKFTTLPAARSLLGEALQLEAAGRKINAPARLAWLGARIAPHAPARAILEGYLPHPARVRVEEPPTEDRVASVGENPHFVRPVTPAMMKWANRLALSLGIEGPQGEERADLEEFALRVRAWLATRPFDTTPLRPQGEENRLDFEAAGAWLLRYAGGAVRRLAAILWPGVEVRDYTPLTSTLLGAVRASDPVAWLEARAGGGNRTAGRLLALPGRLTHPQVEPLLRQARGVWVVHSAHLFADVVLGKEETPPAAPVPRPRRVDPLGVSEWVLVASATSPRPEEREAFEAFLAHLVNIVDQDGEVEWIDPLHLYRRVEGAFREALQRRYQGDSPRPVAAACLTLRVEAQRARAGIGLGRPASEEAYQALNLVWFILGEARSQGRVLEANQAIEALKCRFGVVLSPEAESEVAEYLAVSQGLVTYLDNPVEGSEDLTFGEAIAAPGGVEDAMASKEREALAKEVGEALAKLTKALQEEGRAPGEARALVGCLWAKHARGLEGASAIRRWVETQPGMDPAALPAADEELLATIEGLEVFLQALLLPTYRRWQG